MESGENTQEQGTAILSLGSINADFQMRVERRPEVSETLVGRDFARFGGGKAANVAFAARRLGAPAVLLGVVGDDDLAEQALAPLRRCGVDLSGVSRVSACDTGVALVTVPPDGNKGIVLATNANDVWSREQRQALEQRLQQCSPGQLLVLDCEIPGEVLHRAIQLATEKKLRVVLDPSPADRVDAELIRAASVITPNQSEARGLTGLACDDREGSRRAGLELLRRGAGAACMKLEEGGCVLVQPQSCCCIEALPVEVEDTTGAGDVFAATLAVAVNANHELKDAARLAVAGSHLAVTRYGSQAAAPSWGEVCELASRLEVSELEED